MAGTVVPSRSSRPDPRCPVRPGEACTLCQPGATGPADCALVWLVRSDPDLSAQLAVLTAEHRREQAAARADRQVAQQADERPCTPGDPCAA
ncbi:DUF6767 domain-containing protein [Nocardioides sp. GY 10127]|uniref:DUF6767 domain-containing protein n=1 Tax=Nocardioides sp. GY 10127 TaxID=2569762 RepID=UPI0010A907BB|nr:DUF6767 domain-containing protein [Nocardioides sp. GY 10127]TIC80802.1 hypothetical protein E8D37_13155 [Nocardioides sp. GY 10127]